MNLNADIATRDKLIFGRYRPNRYKFNNTASFNEVDIDILNQLIENNYLDPESKCGDKTVEEILTFMQKYPSYKAHGILFGDGRVIIEGVQKGIPHSSVEEFQDFMELFKNFEHFDFGTMYVSVN